MNTTDWTVIALAALAITAVNWYFLGRRRGVRADTVAAGVQRVTIRVEGGYDPAVVEVDAGRPLELTFDRRENHGAIIAR